MFPEGMITIKCSLIGPELHQAANHGQLNKMSEGMQYN
jgi:hypothetical protein